MTPEPRRVLVNAYPISWERGTVPLSHVPLSHHKLCKKIPGIPYRKIVKSNIMIHIYRKMPALRKSPAGNILLNNMEKVEKDGHTVKMAPYQFVLLELEKNLRSKED